MAQNDNEEVSQEKVSELIEKQRRFEWDQKFSEEEEKKNLKKDKKISWIVKGAILFGILVLIVFLWIYLL